MNFCVTCFVVAECNGDLGIDFDAPNKIIALVTQRPS